MITMKHHKRRPLATPQGVIEDHGGTVPFWMSWIQGDLDSELQAWFREQAAGDAELRKDLQSIEQKAGAGFTTQTAREIVGNVLEASSYLVAVEAAEAEEGVTDVALTEEEGADSGPAALPQRLREKVRPG